jgi:hypothetical protein
MTPSCQGRVPSVGEWLGRTCWRRSRYMPGPSSRSESFGFLICEPLPIKSSWTCDLDANHANGRAFACDWGWSLSNSYVACCKGAQVLAQPFLPNFFSRFAAHNLPSNDAPLFMRAIAAYSHVRHSDVYFPFGRRPVSLLSGLMRGFRSPSGNG